MHWPTRFAMVVGVVTGCQSGSGVPPNEPTPQASPSPMMVLTPMSVAAAAIHEAAPPWTLTASDGSGLQVTRVDAKAVVQGPLAFTELHLYFHNPEDRTREGTFAITLPPGAAVSRFAMELNGQMQEAEIVEKAMARRVYDDFLHRRQDPALLEKGVGNQFTAKVFPISGKADKHLVISFSQELAGERYALPLRGLPKLERVDIVLGDGTEKGQKLTERNWQPDRDFIATAPSSAAAVTAGTLVAGTFSMTAGPAAPATPPQRITLLVDTSASRALGYRTYVATIHDLVNQLRSRYGDGLVLQVIAFDQNTQPIFEGRADQYTDAADSALLARGAAGASNLAQAIAALRTPHERLVVVTDGVLTAGPETPVLVAAIRRLKIQRLDVVLAGGIRDERLAASIARAGLPLAGDVFDLDRSVGDVATGLGQPVLVDVAIEVPGATWVYPKRLAAARPGSTQLMYARMARPTQQIQVVVGGVPHALELATATPALVDRAVAGAEIEDLENQLDAATDATRQAALRADIAKRSVAARVISSQTSMLVLESDADYERYKIPRSALSDILVIGPTGIEQAKRAGIVTATASRPPQRPSMEPRLGREQAIDEARSAGVLGQAALEQGTAFEAISVTGDISSGFDDKNVYGDLVGTEVGESEGGYGFGRGGVGPGGGGTGSGLIGTGRYGTTGKGSGVGSGYGIAGGRGGMRRRAASMPTISIGQPNVQGSLDKAIIRRYIKRNIQKIQYCYERELLASPGLGGTLVARFVIAANGMVATVRSQGVSTTVASCITNVIKDIEFPRSQAGGITVTYPLTFSKDGTTPSSTPNSDAAASEWSRPDDQWGAPIAPPGTEPEQQSPLTGKLATVMSALATGDLANALEVAQAWHTEAPGDVLALIALGEALEAKQDKVQAARVYGSIIDLFPSRADLRRFAGERLERIGGEARALVIDTYRRAVADRPDHVTGHRLLAHALARSGDFAGAFAAILAAVDAKYPGDRFLGAKRVLEEDAGIIAAAYLAHGGAKAEIDAALQKRSLVAATGPSTRFILYWETDANDVDFHIRDARGGHAWYSEKQLASGGELYADVTTGYGPECFAIQGTPAAGPYELSINYFSQGPMGYGMGLLQIERFDGQNLAFEDRPYVIMVNHAVVELGTVK